MGELKTPKYAMIKASLHEFVRILYTLFKALTYDHCRRNIIVRVGEFWQGV